MLISRNDQDDAMRHLGWRIRLFSIGAGLGLGGIWLDSSWLIWGALAALLAGMLVRFAPVEGEVEEGEGAAEAE